MQAPARSQKATDRIGAGKEPWLDITHNICPPRAILRRKGKISHRYAKPVLAEFGNHSLPCFRTHCLTKVRIAYQSIQRRSQFVRFLPREKVTRSRRPQLLPEGLLYAKQLPEFRKTPLRSRPYPKLRRIDSSEPRKCPSIDRLSRDQQNSSKCQMICGFWIPRVAA